MVHAHNGHGLPHTQLAWLYENILLPHDELGQHPMGDNF
jgi:hypothetical protein